MLYPVQITPITLSPIATGVVNGARIQNAVKAGGSYIILGGACPCVASLHDLRGVTITCGAGTTLTLPSGAGGSVLRFYNCPDLKISVSADGNRLDSLKTYAYSYAYDAVVAVDHCDNCLLDVSVANAQYRGLLVNSCANADVYAGTFNGFGLSAVCMRACTGSAIRRLVVEDGWDPVEDNGHAIDVAWSASPLVENCQVSRVYGNCLQFTHCINPVASGIVGADAAQCFLKFDGDTGATVKNCSVSRLGGTLLALGGMNGPVQGDVAISGLTASGVSASLYGRGVDGPQGAYAYLVRVGVTGKSVFTGVHCSDVASGVGLFDHAPTDAADCMVTGG